VTLAIIHRTLCAVNPNLTTKTAIPCILHYPSDGISCRGEGQLQRLKSTLNKATFLRIRVAAGRKMVSLFGVRNFETL